MFVQELLHSAQVLHDRLAAVLDVAQHGLPNALCDSRLECRENFTVFCHGDRRAVDGKALDGPRENQPVEDVREVCSQVSVPGVLGDAKV
jgi:phenylpropionate dioxygenase-like ring-hydroxylating dioxygenase large terminal subunit